MEILNLTYILLLLGAGIFSGLAAGLMGVGGGLINVPALFYIFKAMDHPQSESWFYATGTSLAIIILTSLSAARTHYSSKNLLIRVSVIAGLFGALGSSIAVSIAVNMSDVVLRISFAILLFAAGIKLAARKEKKTEATLESEFQLQVWKLGIIGFFSGILAGFFGIGGGLIGVPLFMIWSKLTPHKAIGSSCGMVVILSVFGALRNALETVQVPMEFSIGYINLPAWILTACSSILAAHFGARLANRAKAKTLTIIFACGLFATGIKMLIG